MLCIDTIFSVKDMMSRIDASRGVHRISHKDGRMRMRKPDVVAGRRKRIEN